MNECETKHTQMDSCLFDGEKYVGDLIFWKLNESEINDIENLLVRTGSYENKKPMIQVFLAS